MTDDVQSLEQSMIVFGHLALAAYKLATEADAISD